jgi:hypothetical protein
MCGVYSTVSQMTLKLSNIPFSSCSHNQKPTFNLILPGLALSKSCGSN